MTVVSLQYDIYFMTVVPLLGNQSSTSHRQSPSSARGLKSFQRQCQPKPLSHAIASSGDNIKIGLEGDRKRETANLSWNGNLMLMSLISAIQGAFMINSWFREFRSLYSTKSITSSTSLLFPSWLMMGMP